MSAADRARWDARWRERDGPGAPSPFVVSLAPLLPARGRALDVAGGGGRHALWLAAQGLDVTLVDVSPVAVDLARAAAAAAGLRLDARVLDLDPGPPPGPWDVALSFHYLDRRLLAALPATLAPGGLLLFVQPTRRNLERHAHPGAAFLLEEGEAATLAAASGLEVVRLEEGWNDEGRHEARLVLRRPVITRGG